MERDSLLTTCTTWPHQWHVLPSDWMWPWGQKNRRNRQHWNWRRPELQQKKPRRNRRRCNCSARLSVNSLTQKATVAESSVKGYETWICFVGWDLGDLMEARHQIIELQHSQNPSTQEVTVFDVWCLLSIGHSHRAHITQHHSHSICYIICNVTSHIISERDIAHIINHITYF